MVVEKIHVIINPASGTEEPVLRYLNKGLEHSGINWDVTVIHKKHDIQHIVNGLIGKVDLIAVYGGDGTVVKVAQALIGKDTPIAIIPGGTANVMAKELGIPIDTVAAIAMLKSNDIEIKKIDTGLMNGLPFLIRVNFGIMADMVSDINMELKESFGQVAYGISALENIIDATPKVYKMKIDGEEIIEEGVSLTVTNSGNIGVAGYSFLPNISVVDGLLDVILLDHATLLSIARVAGSTLLQTDSDVLKRWKCKEITIRLDRSRKFICDDKEEKSKTIHIKVMPKSLNVVTPFSHKLA